MRNENKIILIKGLKIQTKIKKNLNSQLQICNQNSENLNILLSLSSIFKLFTTSTYLFQNKRLFGLAL
jgi:hypothetical protein